MRSRWFGLVMQICEIAALSRKEKPISEPDTTAPRQKTNSQQGTGLARIGLDKESQDARGTPKKYVRGSNNKRKTENEIASTAKKYKAGATKSQMDAIVKKRVASGKKSDSTTKTLIKHFREAQCSSLDPKTVMKRGQGAYKPSGNKWANPNKLGNPEQGALPLVGVDEVDADLWKQVKSRRA